MIQVPMKTKPAATTNNLASVVNTKYGKAVAMSHLAQQAQPASVCRQAQQAQSAPVRGQAQQAQPHRVRQKASGMLLQKGQKVSLNSFLQGQTQLQVALGWDTKDASVYDLDVECFLLGDNGKVLGDDWFVYYNETDSPDGALHHMGELKADAFDDESISIDFGKVHPKVSRMVLILTIDEARERNLNFSGVSNAYVRILDGAAEKEWCRFSLTDYYSTVNSMVVAEIYRYKEEWKMNAVGNGTQADLLELCMRYGVKVSD